MLQEDMAMHASYDDYTRSRSDRGPAVYFGYCGRTNRYRMMDLPDYMSSVQQGMSRWMADASSMYQDIARGYGRSSQPGTGGVRARSGRDCGCGCDDSHCECCVCHADVLVHARCGELRRIPVTFENDTRRERPVTLQIEPFKTAGGRDLKWAAQLSATEFTLRPCDEHTVSIAVQVRCDAEGGRDNPDQPDSSLTNVPRVGRVDRCEVGYATLRADGCLVRPVVVAVAVLPDDCDAYRRPCGCGCCH
jgi:hypothetical protein